MSCVAEIPKSPSVPQYIAEYSRFDHIPLWENRTLTPHDSPPQNNIFGPGSRRVQQRCESAAQAASPPVRRPPQGFGKFLQKNNQATCANPAGGSRTCHTLFTDFCTIFVFSSIHTVKRGFETGAPRRRSPLTPPSQDPGARCPSTTSWTTTRTLSRPILNASRTSSESPLTDMGSSRGRLTRRSG